VRYVSAFQYPREYAPLTIQRCFLKCAFGVMETVVWFGARHWRGCPSTCPFATQLGGFPKSLPDSPAAVGRHLAGKAHFSGVCMRVLCGCSSVFVRYPISAASLRAGTLQIERRASSSAEKHPAESEIENASAPQWSVHENTGPPAAHVSDATEEKPWTVWLSTTPHK
jgi:hypothetical protein